MTEKKKNALRRTKIVATLGPSSDDHETIQAMIRAGADVFRLNFSHGEADEHRRRAETIRSAAQDLGRDVAILADMQGPKIRLQRFRDGSVVVEAGGRFTFDIDCPPDAGDEHCVGLTYRDLPRDVGPGDRLLIDDGKIVMQVDSVEGGKVHCTVVVGGVLSNNKGINRQGGGLSASAITDKDRADIRTAVDLGADYIAISFPRDENDVREARSLVRAAGGHSGIVAKIERAESLSVIEGIISASDAIMVARGDLGVEIGDAELPGVQKHLIHLARSMNCIVITATQMMMSMVENQIPTRAEVFDVANAVLDGTDAVMLSDETAVGRHPVLAIEAMDRVCKGAERQKLAIISRHRVNADFLYIDESVAMATMYTANHLHVRVIAAMTESGSTVQWMSRISSGIPIIALTRHESTRRRVALFRGVYPLAFEVDESMNHLQINDAVIDELKRQGLVCDGELVIVTKGDMMGMHGRTNTMKILRVGDRPA